MENYFEQFFKGYIAAALWSSTYSDEEDKIDYTFDQLYDIDDIAPEALEAMKADCRLFYDANKTMLEEEISNEEKHANGMLDWSRAGQDFWLTQAGHGAGFWDGDWPIHGDALTEACKAFGECNLYLGDDNKIYCE